MHINPTDPRYAEAIARLLRVMNELREQCPWDQTQTFESLRHLTIEETYELGDAILGHNLPEIKKELGDLLLHIVFYARLGAEQDAFDLADIINVLCEKLVHRHPHVYGETAARDVESVRGNWERLKHQERGRKSGVLSGVPSALPALIKAWRIQQKARGAGFDWSESESVWHKVEEELREFHHWLRTDGPPRDQAAAEAEFGDLLFSLINYARFVNIDPENALERTNLKFIRRFEHMEQALEQQGLNLHEQSIETLERYWQAAKQAD